MRKNPSSLGKGDVLITAPVSSSVKEEQVPRPFSSSLVRSIHTGSSSMQSSPLSEQSE